MDQECYRIVCFSQGSLRTRYIKIHKRAFYILAFLLCFLMLFLCDYIQVKKKAFDLNRLRQEAQFQKSQIQFFTTRIDELEGQLSRLMDFDKRIRMIANLERNQDMVPFIGVGGVPSNVRNNKLKSE